MLFTEVKMSEGVHVEGESPLIFMVAAENDVFSIGCKIGGPVGLAQVAYLLGLELVSGVLDPVEDLEMLGLLVTGHLLHLAGVLPHLSQVLRG